jgi:hypothetical protein
MDVAGEKTRNVCPQATAPEGSGEDWQGGDIDGVEANGINHGVYSWVYVVVFAFRQTAKPRCANRCAQSGWSRMRRSEVGDQGRKHAAIATPISRQVIGRKIRMKSLALSQLLCRQR